MQFSFSFIVVMFILGTGDPLRFRLEEISIYSVIDWM